MTTSHLLTKAQEYLHYLCVQLSNRRVGSAANRAATAFFAERVAAHGFQTECPEFDCIDWVQQGVRLSACGDAFEAFASPYSLGGHFRAPLAIVSTVAELEAVQAAGHILLLRGEIAKEQLFPKNFPFLTLPEHQRIIKLLEIEAPQAIVAATAKNPSLAGGVYPFALIVDGDFDIPSVYITDVEGDRLAQYAGQEVELSIHARRIPTRACNVVARKGPDDGSRIVLCAHIDATVGTPGALDNAAGIVILLLLAELLASYDPQLGIEIVALNGEDYYSSAGEVHYLASNRDRLADILLAINLDDVGYIHGPTAYSLYECPPTLAQFLREELATVQDLVEGDLWYQSDHMLFVQNQVAALAMISARGGELMQDIVHTPKDRPELVDCSKLVGLAQTLRGLLEKLERLDPRRMSC